MGMFDNVKCDFPLPWPEAAEFGYEWQTKDTDAQYLDQYEIRTDGTLWHEAYEMRIEETDESPFGFFMHRDNRRWRIAGGIASSSGLRTASWLTGFRPLSRVER